MTAAIAAHEAELRLAVLPWHMGWELRFPADISGHGSLASEFRAKNGRSVLFLDKGRRQIGKTVVEMRFTVVEARRTHVEHRRTDIEMRCTDVEHRRMDVEMRCTVVEQRRTGIEMRCTVVEHRRTVVEMSCTRIEHRWMDIEMRSTGFEDHRTSLLAQLTKALRDRFWINVH